MGIVSCIGNNKQEVLENGRKSSHVARELVPWNDIASGEAGSGLSNTKQAALIQSTFENMVSSYKPATPVSQASNLANAMRAVINQTQGQNRTNQASSPAPNQMTTPAGISDINDVWSSSDVMQGFNKPKVPIIPGITIVDK